MDHVIYYSVSLSFFSMISIASIWWLFYVYYSKQIRNTPLTLIIITSAWIDLINSIFNLMEGLIPILTQDMEQKIYPKQIWGPVSLLWNWSALSNCFLASMLAIIGLYMVFGGTAKAVNSTKWYGIVASLLVSIPILPLLGKSLPIYSVMRYLTRIKTKMNPDITYRLWWLMGIITVLNVFNCVTLIYASIVLRRESKNVVIFDTLAMKRNEHKHRASKILIDILTYYTLAILFSWLPSLLFMIMQTLKIRCTLLYIMQCTITPSKSTIIALCVFHTLYKNSYHEDALEYSTHKELSNANLLRATGYVKGYPSKPIPLDTTVKIESYKIKLASNNLMYATEPDLTIKWSE
ncbi:hypothetical protein BC833DRAFT_602649 [Globomyces pollinis-pini]|nr:hypothetical protein BC833DRAFT_602649 [Globomyces pollinis-pini]